MSKQERFEMTDAELIKATRALVTSPVSQSMKMADRLTYRLEAANQRIEGLERENIEQRRVLANQKKDYEKLAVAYDEACNNLRADIERLKGLLQNGEKKYQGLERELSAERNARAEAEYAKQVYFKLYDDAVKAWGYWEKRAEQAEAKVAAVEAVLVAKVDRALDPQWLKGYELAKEIRKALATQSPEPASKHRCWKWFHIGDNHQEQCQLGLGHSGCCGRIPEPAAVRAAKCEHRWGNAPSQTMQRCEKCGERRRSHQKLGVAPQPSQALREKAIDAVYEIGGTRAYGEKFIDAIIALIEARHAR